MELDDVLEPTHLFEILGKLDPVVLDNFVAEVVDDVLAVVQHTLVKAVGMHVAGQRSLLGGLQDVPGLVQLTFDILTPEQMSE